MTEKLTIICQIYFDVLSRQGIKIPTLLKAARTSFQTQRKLSTGTFRFDAQFRQVVKEAGKVLEKSDTVEHAMLMNHAGYASLRRGHCRGQDMV